VAGAEEGQWSSGVLKGEVLVANFWSTASIGDSLCDLYKGRSVVMLEVEVEAESPFVVHPQPNVLEDVFHWHGSLVGCGLRVDMS
jgi:hypothetical protein